MKRVLVISYYWPPSGGSGVQRWVKFAKYLPAEDWQPVIYTPENPELTATDKTLADEIPGKDREDPHLFRKCHHREVYSSEEVMRERSVNPAFLMVRRMSITVP